MVSGPVVESILIPLQAQKFESYCLYLNIKIFMNLKFEGVKSKTKKPDTVLN